MNQMPDANGLAFLFSGQYMGCVEVLQSMRALDFGTRTQVTRCDNMLSILYWVSRNLNFAFTCVGGRS